MKTPIAFGKYLLVDRINVGGMAEVFLAKSFGVEGFERVLAIKRILPNMADDDEFINMFVDEARIAVQLSHANVVQIYELGKFENQYYIAMEYVSGKDLRQVLDGYRRKQQTMPVPAAAFVTAKVCEGLDYAHRKADPTGRPLNVVHRDVSPQNILVSFEGAVKITDFGIAKAEDRASKTQAGVLKGKFGYMSPEQVRGLEVDHRSDVFAVGILLYEMVTGKRLFVGESDFSTLEKVRNAEIVPPRQIIPELPEALEQVMMKALAREREERYAWASDLHDDLQQFLIEENTIFNAKRVSALFKAEFAEDIERERQRMEEFMRVQAPAGYMAAQQAAGIHGAADVRGEKTMIFESGALGADLSSAPTAVSAEIAPPAVVPARPTPGGVTGAARVSVVRKAPVATSGRGAGAGAAPGRRNLGPLIVGITLLVSVAALLTVLLLAPGASTGTLIVTSEPIHEVEVFLDGQRIGARTPIAHPNVALGVHVLRAQAPGFQEKAYRFELTAPTSASIHIRLDPVPGNAASPQAPAGGPTPVEGSPAVASAGEVVGVGGGSEAATSIPQVEIRSEPPDARVRVGGIPQGQTPLTLAHAGANQPLVFELSKPDYKTVTETVVLQPGELKRTVVVKLERAAPGAKVAATRLVIRSTPEGAVVSSGAHRLGITPLEIPGLDPAQTYSLKITKDGYRDFETAVQMQGRSEVVVAAELEHDRRAEAAASPAKRPAAGGGSGAGGGCGGAGGKLSVIAQGVGDCKVTVGRASIGVAPFVNRDVPLGRCDVAVSCPNGRKYRETRSFKSGTPEKLVIAPDMWQ